MRRLRALSLRVMSLLRSGQVEKEFAAELDAHLALHIEDGMRAGLSESEARRQALIKLGGAEQARQAHRDGRGLLWLENFVQDVRYGLRTLRRSPGFAVTAVLTLGLGIGACTAIFSLVNAVLIRSLPYGDPERLVYLFTPSPSLKIPDEVISPGYADFYDILGESRLYENASNFEQALFSVATQGPGQRAAQRIGAARVDENFFTTLESAPELGRAIGAEDNQPGHEKVAAISHALWMSMFGGDPSVLGRTLELDGTNYRIVGVMGPGFEYPFSSDLPYGNSEIKTTDIWVPLSLTAKERAQRGPGNNTSIARLRPGVSVGQAHVELNAIMARLDKQYPGVAPFQEVRDWRGLVESFVGLSIGPVRPLMRLLVASVFLVLLIACGNAANLLLAHASRRARELGVRAALGAGRGRMVRQLLTESLLICAAGGAVGLALALLFLRILPRLDPGNIPRLNEASIDLRVLLFTVAAAVITGVLSGGLPALSVLRMQLTEFLKTQGAQGGSAKHSRVQSALIMAQTAMVVVLLTGAGLLIRSYINVVSVHTGFSPSTVTMNLALGRGYSKPEQCAAFNQRLFARLRALPGVQAVGSVSNLPLSNSEGMTFTRVEGQADLKDQLVESRSVTPGYLEAMQIPVIAGRAFTQADNDPANVAIVNEAFARVYFGRRSPLGAHISTDDNHQKWPTIVGVIADVRHTSLEEVPQPQVYVPDTRMDFEDAYVALRSTLPAATTEAEIRVAVQELDPQVTVSGLGTMGDLISQASARRRFQTSLLTAFAGIALLLGLVGLYGLMAYSVNRRTREVGVRMALGAQRSDVLLLVLKNAGFLVGAGLGLGLIAAWIATRFLRSFLFGVSPHDPFTIAAVCVLLLICGLSAAFVPARRAASTEPMQALRSE